MGKIYNNIFLLLLLLFTIPCLSKTVIKVAVLGSYGEEYDNKTWQPTIDLLNSQQANFHLEANFLSADELQEAVLYNKFTIYICNPLLLLSINKQINNKTPLQPILMAKFGEGTTPVLISKTSLEKLENRQIFCANSTSYHLKLLAQKENSINLTYQPNTNQHQLFNLFINDNRPIIISSNFYHIYKHFKINKIKIPLPKALLKTAAGTSQFFPGWILSSTATLPASLKTSLIDILSNSDNNLYTWTTPPNIGLLNKYLDVPTSISKSPSPNKAQIIMIIFVICALFATVLMLLVQVYNLRRVIKNLQRSLQKRKHQITEQKNLEQALLKACNSREELEQIIDYSPTICFLLKNKPSWPIEFITENIQLFGYDIQKFYSGEQNLLSIVHPEDSQMVEQFTTKITDMSNNETSIEFRVMTKKGEVRWVDERIYLRRDHKNKVTHLQGVLVDITQQKKSEEALKEANKKTEDINRQLQKAVSHANQLTIDAETANAIKSQFIASINHDIRTPMNGIIGITNLLNHSKLNKKQQEYIDTIHKCSNQLLEILSEMLEYAHIQGNNIALEFSTFNIKEFFKDTCNALSIKAHAKGLELFFQIDKGIPTYICTDSQRLHQIISNLLESAIKRTNQGEININLSIENDTILQLNVDDSSSNNFNQLENMLYHSLDDQSKEPEELASRLNIAIAKKITEKMQGEIGLNIKNNLGTSIYIAIPIKKAEKGDQLEYNVLKNKTFLVIDDARSNLEILKHILGNWGAKCLMAQNEQETMKLLIENQVIDAIIIDATTQDIDGETLGKKLSEHPHFSQIPLLLMTTFDDSEDLQRIKKIGFASQISKPIHEQQLLKKLEKLTSQATAPKKVVSKKDKKSFKILVADDNAVNRTVAQGTLANLSYPSKTVVNGNEAVIALSKESYDLVFMDLQMPIMDGIEATRAIRDKSSSVINHEVPIIAMTAHVTKQDQKHCFEMGMNDFIGKPIDANKLNIILEKWLVRSTETSNHQLKPMTFDKKKLLKRVGNDAGLLMEIVEIFISEIPQQLTEIENALVNNNLTEVANRANMLFSSAGSSSAISIRDISAKLVIAAKNENKSYVSTLIDELKNAFTDFITETNNLS